MAAAVEFMKHPLVIWVGAFKEEKKPLDFTELVDGVFLNDIMLQIDPRPANMIVNREVNGDVNLRIQNLDNVLRNIKSYYQDILQQLIVMSLPNILLISREPESEQSVQELHKLLLLMLGCAVQCERKEIFIEKIKQLDIDVQHAIVGHIQEITDNTGNVFCMQWSELTEIPAEQLDALARNMFEHLKRVVKERDDYAEVITELSQEKEYLHSQVDINRLPISPPATPDKDKQHHISVELADTKAKLRRMRQELEEKNEQSMETKEELEQCNLLIQKLKQENLDLTQDARAARAYRDELDVLKEKASKVDKYEGEIQRYREKLNEMEYIKKRMEELREDNQLLHDTKALLEEQLDASHRKVERMVQLEADGLRFKQQISELEEEREGDRERIRELMDENAYLRVESKESMNDSASLAKELDIVKKLTSPMGHSLSAEYSDAASTQLLRLERENQRLQHELETLRETTIMENNAKILDLEKENQRLSKKIEKLQAACTKDTKSFVDLEQKYNELRRDKAQLQLSVDSLSKSVERQRKEYEAETEQLSQTIEILRERNQKNADQRTQEIQKENKKLHETSREATNKLSNLEYEHRQLSKSFDRLKEKGEKFEELEKKNAELQEEIEKHQKNNATLLLTCEKVESLEQENSDLDVEKRKLEKSVESMKMNRAKVEEVQSENITLQAEVQKLQRGLETLKSHSAKLSQIEQEKDDLDRQNRQLQKSLQAFQANQEKYTQMEVDNMELENENQRLSKTLELANRKANTLERDIQELESENNKLQKEIENLKTMSKKIEELQRDNKDLEADYANLEKDLKQVEKENKRFRQSMEVKDTTIDDANGKIANLERELKRLKKSLEKNQDSNEKLKEIETDNRDLMQQATVDKKTLMTLREELVSEKIKTQQLSNELEKLSTELHKIGLNKEKILHQELTEDEDRYKALENRMEDALKKSLELKEEKIVALESRLKESVSRNQKLNEELKNVKRDFVVLQQRQEEEQVTSTTPSPPKIQRSESERVSAKEILKMKDHLIELERNNASLETETNSLKTQNENLLGQVNNLQSQNTSLQSQVATLQAQNSNLQSQHAKIQVENTTLNSENSSQKSEISSLKSKNAALEKELERLRAKVDELEGRHEILRTDQEQLQDLHEVLTQDYESLISEHGSLKSNHKALKSEIERVKEKEKMIEKEQKTIKQEKESLKAEKQSVILLKSENNNSSVQLEYNSLKQMHERLNREYKEMEEDYKTLKSENRQLSLEKASLQGEVADHKEQCQQLDIEIAKMANRCETLQQLNGNLEEENKHLMEQVNKLLEKNTELHAYTLESKEMHFEEEKQFFDKINDLRRQKEKLEEKIMDQYKNYTSPPRRTSRGFKFPFMKKFGKPSHSKEKDRSSRNRSHDHLDSAERSDTSSVGSYPESTDGAGDSTALLNKPEHYASTDDIDAGVVRRRNKRRDPIVMTDYRKSLPPMVGDSGLTVHATNSVSSDDLRGDADSLSSQGSFERQQSGGRRHAHERRNSYEQALTDGTSSSQKSAKDKTKEKDRETERETEKDENTASDENQTAVDIGTDNINLHFHSSGSMTTSDKDSDSDYGYSQTLGSSRGKSGSVDMLSDKPKSKPGLLSRLKSRSREMLDDSRSRSQPVISPSKEYRTQQAADELLSLEQFLEEVNKAPPNSKEPGLGSSPARHRGPVFEGPPDDDVPPVPPKNFNSQEQNDLSKDTITSPSRAVPLTHLSGPKPYQSDQPEQEFVVNIPTSSGYSTSTPMQKPPSGYTGKARVDISRSSSKRMAPPPPQRSSSSGLAPPPRSNRPKDGGPQYAQPITTANVSAQDRPKNFAPSDGSRHRSGAQPSPTAESAKNMPRDRKQAPLPPTGRPRPRPSNRGEDKSGNR
ncbi:girdin-like isoform X5 [Glandiceps talaboti]